MGDLISRKALLQKAVEANPMGGMIGGKFVEDLIKSEPIAYDVDKVVERLIKHWCKDCRKQEMCKDCHIKEFVLDIVKGAVKDE